jgi:DNA-binding FrmR family transcriptional regulator
MKTKTIHKEHLHALRRIEGQVKGIQKMIEEEKYCIDIAIQIHAVVNALHRVSEKVLAKHIEGCVGSTFEKGNKSQKETKILELLGTIKMLHKLG